MKGRRLPDAKADEYTHDYIGKLQPGDYVYIPKMDRWLMKMPNGDEGMISPKIHNITVNADNTITVTPSILCQGATRWHGYLTNGVWRKC